MKVKGKTDVVTVVLTLDTNIYADGDVLAITHEIANAVSVSGGTGVIQSIVVQDDDDQAGILDLVFFDANTSMGAAANAAVAIADGDTILGIQEVVAADYVDMINSQVAHFENVGIVIRGTGTSLYMGAVSRDTKTYTAAGITVRLGILMD